MEMLTELLSKALNILFLYNVTGTTFGILTGLFIIAVQQVVLVYYPIVGHFPWYGSISFGVMFFNRQYFSSAKFEDPNIEKKLKYVRETLKESNLTEEQKRMIWIRTINSIANEITDNTESNEINHRDNSNNVTD